MDVLARLLELVEQKGWSINRLAKEAGITQSTLSSIFSRQTIPSIPTLQKLCNALGLTLAEFFSDTPEEIPPELRQLLKEAKELTPKQIRQLTELVKTMKLG